ncbi:hypothetical protein AT05_05600 [Schleiferia thermophila str. Yellowstone]|nr:hypothetical protein AT05_05600 [Schleiferia thermophila str. Yellowstone]
MLVLEKDVAMDWWFCGFAFAWCGLFALIWW